MEKNALKQLLFVMLLSGSAFAGTTLTKTEVSELYVTLMGRVSEGKGSNYWQNNYSDQTKAAKAMLGSAAVAKYFNVSSMENMSNEDFIGTIYRNTLNKTKDGSNGTIEDASGIAYWNGRLTGDTGAKMSRDEMIVQFITIAQKSITVSGQQFSNRVDVSNYMADIVETAPDDYETSTSFSGNITVTSDKNSVTIAMEYIITYLKDPTTLTDKYSNFTIARTNGLEEVSKTINGLKVVVTTNEPMDEVSPNTIAIYGKIKGKSTDALLKVNSNYSGSAKFIIKVYENSKIVALSEELSLGGEYIEFDDIL